MQNSPRIILLLEATRGFDRGLLSGVARYSALNGPWTFYRQPHGYLKSKRRLDLKELKAWKPDGAICPITQFDELARLRVPLMAYDVLDRMIHGEEGMSGQPIMAHAIGVAVRQSTSLFMVRNADVRKKKLER